MDRPLPTIKEQVKAAVEKGLAKDITSFTCYDCPMALPSKDARCPFAFDLYNTNGDCLWEK